MHTSATATCWRVLMGVVMLWSATSATTVSAQNREVNPVPLRHFERIQGTLDRNSGVHEGRYYVDYSFSAQDGARVSVLLDASTPVAVIELERTASGRLVMTDEEVEYASFSAARVPYYTAWTGEEYYIRVVARDAGATGHFTICVHVGGVDIINSADCQSPGRPGVAVSTAEASSIRGLEIAPFVLGQRLETEGIDHADKSQGWGIRAGIGLGERLQIFGQYSSEIADQGVPENEESPMYDLTSVDLGARLYLTGPASTFRPYVRGTYGWREREEAYDTDYVYYGRSWGGGAGAQVFLGRDFAFDFAGSYNNARYTEITFEDGDRVTLDEPFKATSLRVDLGLSLFLRPASLVDFFASLSDY